MVNMKFGMSSIKSPSTALCDSNRVATHRTALEWSVTADVSPARAATGLDDWPGSAASPAVVVRNVVVPYPRTVAVLYRRRRDRRSSPLLWHLLQFVQYTALPIVERSHPEATSFEIALNIVLYYCLLMSCSLLLLVVESAEFEICSPL